MGVIKHRYSTYIQEGHLHCYQMYLCTDREYLLTMSAGRLVERTTELCQCYCLRWVWRLKKARHSSTDRCASYRVRMMGGITLKMDAHLPLIKTEEGQQVIQGQEGQIGTLDSQEP